MPHFQHTIDVAAPVTAVFGILDDIARTPEWLDRCISIETLSDGPNAVGTQLKYQYQDAGRTGDMDGEIVAYEPGRHLAMRFVDKMTDVTVDFVAEPAAGNADRTSLTHTIDLKTKGFSKLFTPLIAISMPKRTRSSMEKLRSLAEA